MYEREQYIIFWIMYNGWCTDIVQSLWYECKCFDDTLVERERRERGTIYNPFSYSLILIWANTIKTKQQKYKCWVSNSWNGKRVAWILKDHASELFSDMFITRFLSIRTSWLRIWRLCYDIKRSKWILESLKKSQRTKQATRTPTEKRWQTLLSAHQPI